MKLQNPFSGISVQRGGGGANSINPFNPSYTIGDIITVLLPYVYSIAAILLLVYLTLGGLQLMSSKGDPKAVEGAKGKITNSLIGFGLLVLSYAIVSLLGQALGIPQFGQIFK